MKVLWFSNGILSMDGSKGSGSWLHAMRDLIAGDIELVNITLGSVKTIVENRGNNITEFLLPQWKLNKGVPSKENIQRIAAIVEQVNPDVIHIWGIEKYWALLFSRGFIKHPHVLLEMQGVAAGSSNAYYGGLKPDECNQLWSIKSFFLPKQKTSSLYDRMRRNSLYEEEVLPYFPHVAIQSDWTRDQLRFICNNDTQFHYSYRPIRKEFYEAKKWEYPENSSPIIYASFSYFVPFKGAHYLFYALSLLKQRYPNVQLRLAGPNFYSLPFYRGSEYERFLRKLIDKLGIKDNIYFCGSLNASIIVEEILKADVVVNPSLVESYSAAAAEALYLGAPTVLSYAGAMVNFSKEKPVALYYSPMDYRSLAARIIAIIENEIDKSELLRNAIEVMSAKSDPERVKEKQLQTYRVLEKK